MPPRAEPIVRAFYKAYLARDIPRMLSMCDENVRFTQHFDCAVPPFSGTVVGHAALEDYARGVFAVRHVEESVQVFVTDDGEFAETLTSYKSRHLFTGKSSEGMLRQTWRIGDGNIIEIAVQFDAAGLDVLRGIVEARTARFVT